MNKVDKAYTNAVTFLQLPHHRDEFIDKRVAIALYSNPLSLYIHVNRTYFLAEIKKNRKTLWTVEGYKYEI